MRALVTGGAGFIGSTLVDRLLAEDWRVDVVDDLSTGSLGNLNDARSQPDRRFSFHRLDIASGAVTELIAHRRPDVIFHLAAQADVRVSVSRPVFDATVNILGSLNVLEGAVGAGVSKVVFASSGGTIYGTPEEVPTREGSSQRPVSPYGVAKKTVGDYLHYYREVRGLEYSALALANVYGPRQDPHGEAGVVSIFAGKLLAHERPVIYGDGEQTRDFVYVDDVVQANMRAMFAPYAGPSPFNVASGSRTTLNALAAQLGEIIGVQPSIVRGPARAGDIRHSAANITAIRRALAYDPRWTTRAGLEALVASIRAAAPPPQS